MVLKRTQPLPVYARPELVGMDDWAHRVEADLDTAGKPVGPAHPPLTTTTSNMPTFYRIGVQTVRMAEALNLPSPCVIVLVGPGASGKSTWAAAHFPADRIVSSDRLRALVGVGEDDIDVSTDAFPRREDRPTEAEVLRAHCPQR